MVSGETPTGSESKSGESSSPKGAPHDAPHETKSAAAPAAGGTVIDFPAVGKAAVRILRDPLGGPEACYRPGQQALIQGLVLGVGALVLIPLVQFIGAKILYGDFSPGARWLFQAMLGGVLFVGAGIGIGLVLRVSIGKAKAPNWQDDVYLFGSSMVFMLAGTVVGVLVATPGKEFFFAFGNALTLLGLVAAAFCYHAGLVRVGKVTPERALCIATVAFGAALLLGALVEFRPTQVMGQGFFVDFGRAFRSSMEPAEGLKDILKGLGQ